MTCRKCGSNEWKYASVVHAGGTSVISSTTVGAGVAGGDGFSGDTSAIGIGRTSAQQQTELAKKAAPPVKPMRPAKAFAILGVILFVIGVVFFGNTSSVEYPVLTSFFFVLSPAITLISLLRLLFTPGISKKMEAAHQQVLKAYERKRMCMRCGEFSSDEPPEAKFEAVTQPHTKQCPFCAETIRAEAILCKHCHSRLDADKLKADLET